MKCPIMKCPICKTEMIWMRDEDKDDSNIVVSVFYCPECSHVEYINVES